MKIEMVTNHPIVELSNGKYFIDTGSSSSYSHFGQIEWNAKMVSVPTHIRRFTVQFLQKYISRELVGLLGRDLLFKQNILIDYPNERFELNPPAIENALFKVDMIKSRAYLGLKLVVNGVRLKAALDTGAPQAYIKSSMVQGMEPVGRIRDFSPHCGEFEADVYPLNWQIGGQDFKGTFGILPPDLEEGLMIDGVDCIIGWELLHRFAVEFDFEGGVLRFAIKN